MEKKSYQLPFMKTSKKKIPIPSQNLSFQARSTLGTRVKENYYGNDYLSTKAKSIIDNYKKIDSPHVVFELTEQIKEEINKQKKRQYSSKNIKNQQIMNRTFHFSSKPSQRSNLQSTKSIKTKNHYAIHKERQKALDLLSWIKNNVNKLCEKKTVEIEDILDYKQTILNYGLGQIIHSVTQRCKQEGQTLHYIWDSTFILFENLLSSLVKIIQQKDVELIKNQRDLQKIYLLNLNSLKEKNTKLSENLEQLYEKMKNIILWNRNLRNDRRKQAIQNRILSYRITTYSEALEEAINMLLTETQEPNCLSLAKKIISKLYRDKIRKKKNIYTHDAKQHVNQKAKQFVQSWLKKYTLESENDILTSINLSFKEKLELGKNSDREEGKDLNIYDYFKTYSIATQTSNETQNQQIQYNYEQEKIKTCHIGIGTKKIITISQLTQTLQQSDEKYENCKSKKQQNLNSKRGGNYLRDSKASLRIPDNKRSKGKKKMTGQISKNSIGFEREIFEDNHLLGDRKNYHILINKESFEKQSGESYQNKNNFEESYGLWQRKSGRGEQMNPFNHLGISRRKRNSTTYAFIEECKYTTPDLDKKLFNESYEAMKEQLKNDRDSFQKSLTRRRSFYKKKKNNLFESAYLDDVQKFQRILRLPSNLQKKGQSIGFSSEADFMIYSFNKKIGIPTNITKSKNYTASKNIFNSVFNMIRNAQRTIPKNKQFVTLSINAINKIVSKLIIDYLKKMKREKQEINTDTEKIYYPLSIVLVDQMINRFGLKQIAEKKLKDFLQKVSTFSLVSQKVRLFEKLLGLTDDKIGADQLQIYLKCIVYFDTQKNILNLNPNKEFSLERILTNKTVVLEEMNEVMGEFFPEKSIEFLTEKIKKYIAQQSDSIDFEIQKIATFMIDQFIRRKRQMYKQYYPIYKLCQQGKMMGNFYKLLQIWFFYQEQKENIAQIYEQFHKSADILDQTHERSLTEAKFIGLCLKLNFPTFSLIKQHLEVLQNNLIQVLKLPSLGKTATPESADYLRKLIKSKNIQMVIEGQEDNDLWVWYMARILHQLVEQSLVLSIGRLQIISTSAVPLLFHKN